MIGYIGNIEEITAQNNNFRQVLYTGKHAQLVVMSLLPGEEIGSEVHGNVDQFFRVEVGTIKIIMNGEESVLTDGMAAIVPTGTTHNLINVGADVAKLYTIYSPANHPEGTIHATKAEADESEEAEHAAV
jgi:mannose-6-phosphate isomerase-like protein (cupin superfamily)